MESVASALLRENVDDLKSQKLFVDSVEWARIREALTEWLMHHQAMNDPINALHELVRAIYIMGYKRGSREVLLSHFVVGEENETE